MNIFGVICTLIRCLFPLSPLTFSFLGTGLTLHPFVNSLIFRFRIDYQEMCAPVVTLI